MGEETYVVVVVVVVRHDACFNALTSLRTDNFGFGGLRKLYLDILCDKRRKK